MLTDRRTHAPRVHGAHVSLRVQEAKAAMVEKNAEIAKILQLARQEKETFDRNLAAAKAETLRFREMAESRSDMDDNFKVRLCRPWPGLDIMVALHLVF